MATPYPPKKPYVPRGRVQKEDLHKINNRITAREVRVVGEGIEPKVYPIAVAIKLAQDAELDLVEISSNAVPPVCKIVDYKKFLYEHKKKQKELKAKQAKITVKEIRFGPNTDEHDFNFKVKHAVGFLEEGCKVRAYVFFKGRSIVFKERGEILLLKFVTALEDHGTVEKLPSLEGKKMFIMIIPKKKK